MAYRVSYRRSQGSALGPIGFLIIINIVLWVATSIRPAFFLDLFEVSRNSLLSHPWSIVTSMFIHAPFPSFYHILGNMFTLFFFGNFLNNIVGEKNFFTVYFLGGIIGNLFFLWLAGPVYYNPALGQFIYPSAIGASGAVSAVAGALMVLRPKLKVFIIPIPVPVPIWVAVIGLFVVLSIVVPGVAWQAHLGGVVSGAVLGYILKKRQLLFF